MFWGGIKCNDREDLTKKSSSTKINNKSRYYEQINTYFQEYNFLRSPLLHFLGFMYLVSRQILPTKFLDLRQN